MSYSCQSQKYYIIYYIGIKNKRFTLLEEPGILFDIKDNMSSFVVANTKMLVNPNPNIIV